jgi:diadenosine tetraphosphate (Ap4A) HIT family hydrolase
MTDCIFCKIVRGDMPCHKVWESKTHLAFLSIFPNTPGFTVVIPKKHFSSYAFDLSDENLAALVTTAKHVGLLLDRKLGVSRTGLVLEGMGVDHVHAKLIPMHGVKKGKFTPTFVETAKFFDNYEGYLTTLEGKRADDKELAALAKRIRDE